MKIGDRLNRQLVRLIELYLMGHMSNKNVVALKIDLFIRRLKAIV